MKTSNTTVDMLKQHPLEVVCRESTGGAHLDQLAELLARIRIAALR